MGSWDLLVPSLTGEGQHWLLRYTKKTPLNSPPELLNPCLLDLFTFPRCSPLTIGGTVQTGAGVRSWFGRLDATKKAEGSAACNKGINASNKGWADQPHYFFPTVSGDVVVVYELAKKGRGPTLSLYDALPSPKGVMS